MESTGVYWKPIFHVLEEVEGLQVVLANSQQVRNLRGDKTDPNDSRWLAHLLRHGRIRPSYIPPLEIRELRESTRRRKQLVRAGAQERNRVQAVLEDANIKIGNVLTNMFGLSGQLMMKALVEGRATADQIADLAQRQARKTIPQIQAAIEGHRMSDPQRVLIRLSMAHLAFLEKNRSRTWTMRSCIALNDTDYKVLWRCCRPYQVSRNRRPPPSWQKWVTTWTCLGRGRGAVHGQVSALVTTRAGENVNAPRRCAAIRGYEPRSSSALGALPTRTNRCSNRDISGWRPASGTNERLCGCTPSRLDLV